MSRRPPPDRVGTGGTGDGVPIAGDARQERVPSWEEVAREYGGFLYTVAYRLTGDRHDAEDLVQEALLRVRRGLRTYRPGSMEAWLTRIATNAFIDRARRRGRRPEVLVPTAPDQVARSAPAAEDVHLGGAVDSDVQAALMQLPEEYRVAVVLCDVAGLPYEEIAAALGVPLGTVRSRIHRGRALLRKALE